MTTSVAPKHMSLGMVDACLTCLKNERDASAGDFIKLAEILADLEFDSMLKDKSWKKYVDTFRRL